MEAQRRDLKTRNISEHAGKEGERNHIIQEQNETEQSIKQCLMRC